MARRIGAEQVVKLFLGRRERLGEQRSALLGRGRLHREKLGADVGGQLFDDVLPARHQLRALLDQLIRREAGGLRGVAWHAVNLAAEFHRQARGNQRTRILRPFDNDNAQRYTGDDPVPDRKVFRRRVEAQRELGDDGAALFDQREQLLVLLRIDDVNAVAEDSDRCAAGGSASALVRRAVNAAGQAAHNHQPALGQVARQPLSHLIPVGRRASRADNRDAVPGQHLRVATKVEQRRRVVNLEQSLRVLRLVPIQQTAAEALDLRQLLLRRFERGLRVNGLCHRRGQVAGLELGQRGAEDGLGRAEMTQQPGGEARRQARSDRQGQPVEGSVQFHWRRAYVDVNKAVKSAGGNGFAGRCLLERDSAKCQVAPPSVHCSIYGAYRVFYASGRTLQARPCCKSEVRSGRISKRAGHVLY